MSACCGSGSALGGGAGAGGGGAGCGTGAGAGAGAAGGGGSAARGAACCGMAAHSSASTAGWSALVFQFTPQVSAPISTTPGRDFGTHEPQRYLRFSTANSMAQLQEAIARLRALLG